MSSYTSLFARPSPPTVRLKHPIHLAVRPVSTGSRPVPPSLFALRARPAGALTRPLALAA